MEKYTGQVAISNEVPARLDALSLFMEKSQAVLQTLETSLAILDRGQDIAVIAADLQAGFNALKGYAGTNGFARVGLVAHYADAVMSTISTRQPTRRKWVVGALFRAMGTLRVLVEAIGRDGHEDKVDISNHLEELQRAARLDTPQPKLSIMPTLKTASNSHLDSVAQILNIFVQETREQLDACSGYFHGSSNGSYPPDGVNELLRCFHTIKGTASFIGLKGVETLTNGAEALLAAHRDRGESLKPHHGPLLSEVDGTLRRMLRALDSGGRDTDVSYGPLTDRLRASASGIPVAASNVLTLMDGPAGACLRLLPKQAVVPTNETSDPIDDLGDVLTQLRALKGHLELEEVSKSSVGNLGGLIGNLGDIIHGMSQEPLSTVLGKMPRLVTTMAEECGKRARLETEGMSVRLDRSYVNSVRDILTHLIRNAVSHGIEDPVTRASLDKPIEGVITVRAEIVGTDLILKVEDDGAGIDGHSIRATAIEKGLIAVQDALSMAPAQLMDLMARPGFSTTRQTDRLSGRGVGLDQVQRILETKGGRIQVASLYGLGAAFIISIPLQESDRSQVSGGAL